MYLQSSFGWLLFLQVATKKKNSDHVGNFTAALDDLHYSPWNMYMDLLCFVYITNPYYSGLLNL